jgi:glutathione S-transferase
MQLYIGNKNYSSWSLRGWLALAGAGIPFDEVRLTLAFSPDSEFHRRLKALGGNAKVPALVDDDGFVVWDSLAIVEYVNEKFPDAGLWPADARQRARARSLCAEMHSGFGALRSTCGMNLEADLRAVGARLWDENAALRADVARIEQLWTDQLAASGGPLLFGSRFTAADAFFAPVATRIRTYGLPVGARANAYIDAVFALPAMQRWVKEALAEHEWVEDDEQYRKKP